MHVWSSVCCLFQHLSSPQVRFIGHDHLASESWCLNRDLKMRWHMRGGTPNRDLTARWCLDRKLTTGELEAWDKETLSKKHAYKR
jgi:hypothetical protein